MAETETHGGVRPSRHPFRVVVVRTLAWSAASGFLAGLVGLLPALVLLDPVLAMVPLFGALIGLGVGLAGLVLGLAAWWALGAFAIGDGLRSGVAAAIPAVAVLVGWWSVVFLSGIGILLASPSIVVTIAAVKLPDTIRTRFLTAVQQEDS